jgi:hypothetical protein
MYQKAIGDYSEAIRLEERNQYFRTGRAKAYRATGQNDLAAQDDAEAEKLSKSQ